MIFALTLLSLALVRALPEALSGKGITSSARNFGEVGQEPSATVPQEEQIRCEAEALRARLGPAASLPVLERAILLAREGEAAVQRDAVMLAIAKLKAAALLFHEEQAQVEEAKVLRRIGFLCQHLGNSAQSLIAYQKALALFRKNGDIAGTAGTLNDLGGTLYKVGRYDEALQVLREGLRLNRTLGSTSAEAASWENLGFISTALGEPHRATDYLLEALRLWQQRGDLAGQSRSLVGLGNVYMHQERSAKALEAFEHAYRLQRALNDRRAEAPILLALGKLTWLRGDYYLALESFERALTMPMEEAQRAQALVDAGFLWSRLGDPDRALRLYQEALQLQRRSGDRSREVQTIYALARAERQKGNLEGALRSSTEALTLIESLRSTVPGPRLRASFLATHHENFELLIGLLADLGRRHPGGGYEVAAFEASERSRARSLLDLLVDGQEAVRQGVAPPLLERERDLKEKLAEVAQARQLGQKSNTDSDVDSSLLKTTLESYEAVQMEIREQGKGYGTKEFHPPLATWPELAKSLDPEVALLEYSLGTERSFLWVVTRDSLTSFELPPKKMIEDLAREAFESLSHGDQRMNAAAANLTLGRLSRVLLAPVQGRLIQKRLAIVADGALQYIPFAALPSPDHPDLPLIVEHEIISLPSASVLVALRAEASHRSVAPKTVAIIADPVFSPTDERLDSTAAQSFQQETVAGSSVFARLPYSRAEAEAILRLVPIGEGSAFLDFGANRRLVTTEALGEYRILHFATHAVIDTEHPDLSGIVLSLVDRAGHPQLGFLGLPEINHLRLRADLVVLSACQTALGKEVHGEGLVGLTQSFYRAGARSVLAGLWGANDRSTAELMQRFYRAMLEQGLPPSAALREAQVSMLREPRFRSPYYWAGFVLQGDWRQERPFLGPSAIGVAGP